MNPMMLMAMMQGVQGAGRAIQGLGNRRGAMGGGMQMDPLTMFMMMNGMEGMGGTPPVPTPNFMTPSSYGPRLPMIGGMYPTAGIRGPFGMLGGPV